MALHLHLGEVAVLPVLVNGKVAHGLQTVYMSLGLPCGGHGGQQLQGVGVALQEHLGYTGATTEVSVNLEGSMCVVEVVVHTAGILVQTIVGGMAQGILQDEVGMVAVQCTCPKVHLPTHAPTGSGIATQLQ